MFDLIIDTAERPLREQSFASKVVALVAHVIVILAIVALTLVQVTDQLPTLQAMGAFIAR